MNRGDTKLQPSRRRFLKGAAGTAFFAATLPIHRAAWAAGIDGSCETLRAAITGYDVINTLDPARASQLPEFYVLWGMYNSLLKFNENMEIVPDLAESWEAVSPTVWRFKLRQGVKFHDGVEVTAEDVVFSLERVKNEDFGSPHRSKYERVIDVRAIDDYTVEIETESPFAPLLSYLTNTRTGSQIVPKHILAETDDLRFPDNPIGTGAFRLRSLESGIGATLDAHPEYFEQGMPRISRVEMPLISEESSGVTALLGGNIDLTSTAPFADVPELEGNPDVVVHSAPGMNTRFIHMNNRVAPFDDPHFRRAISLAFDREVMVRAVVFGEGTPANGIVPSALSWAHRDERRSLLQHNQERALEELAKSRYKAEDQDATVLTWGGNWWQRFAEVFVDMVNGALGTRFRVEVTDANAVYSRLQDGDFEASIWGWLGLIDPDEYLYENLHTNGWRNYQGYSNPEVDRLLEQARSEMDQPARGEIYRQAEDLVVEDAPLIFCFESNVHNLASPRVEGFRQLPYSAYGSQFAGVTDC